MNDNKNSQLVVLVVMGLLSVGSLWYLMSDGRPPATPTPIGPGTRATPATTCVEDRDCGDSNKECTAGVCMDKESVADEAEIACAEGETVTDCSCKPPLQTRDGKCQGVAVDPRCSDANFMKICRKVVHDCGGNAGKDCRSNVFKDFILSDPTTINQLLNAFSGHVALLYPTGQPAAGTDWPKAPLGQRYKKLIKKHFDILFNAKMLIALGRASSVGHAAQNMELAGLRNNSAQAWLLEECKSSGRSQDECEKFKKRITPAGIGEDRPIRLNEFRRFAHPSVRRGGSITHDQRWVLPQDDGQVIRDERKQINRKNGAKQAHVRSLFRALDGRRVPRSTKRIAEQYINQAVLLVPIPCKCK